ncbi:hypothetical protein FA95DRAFT_1554230 [Auriscalpium vulgare]|uniref:Uncharacterized protein n=1 Tax=Auriscalpium vulgare TaxID=40419 RepID=A0ACB8S691_9AGAM|nr:hypothetical protein FA95DRAFT_1554230 [Auriscalpium vulgare]
MAGTRRSLSFAWLAIAFILVSSFLAAPAHAILGNNKWEATSFCKCICFGANYSILHLDIPDNPSKPCLSCTKQWCLNQNLPICAGASLGDTDPDTATGKEGDVEARCFRELQPYPTALFLIVGRARFASRPARGDPLPADRLWPPAGGWYQGQNDESRVGHEFAMEHREEVVAGAPWTV